MELLTNIGNIFLNSLGNVFLSVFFESSQQQHFAVPSFWIGQEREREARFKQKFACGSREARLDSLGCVKNEYMLDRYVYVYVYIQRKCT